MRHRPTATDAHPDSPPSSLVLVTASAALLVVYGNLVGRWVDDNGDHLWLLTDVRRWLNRPLGIGEDFGVFAVMLLLLASGYSVAAATERRGGWRVVAGLVRRSYLPVVVTTVLAASLVAVGGRVWTAPATVRLTVPNLVANLFLSSQLVPDQAELVPLAWVTVVELICATSTVASAGLTRSGRYRVSWLAPVAQLCLVAVVLATGTGALRQVEVVVSFLPLAVIGGLVRSTVAGHTSVWIAVPLGIAGWEMIAYAQAHNPTLTGWWYPVTAAYAVALFLVAVLVAGPTATALARRPMIAWLAGRARWLMLLTGVVGYPLLAILHHRLPLAAALLVAAGATGCAAELADRLASLAGRSRPSKLPPVAADTSAAQSPEAGGGHR